MKILENIYEKSYNSEQNKILKKISVIIICLIMTIISITFIIPYNDVYRHSGIVEPWNEQSISTRYEAIIKNNSIKVGNQYKKNDMFIEFDKNYIKRKIELIMKEIKYYKTKKKALSSIQPLVERNKHNLFIASLQNRIHDLSDQLKENQIFAPFDCVIISSEINKNQNGFLKQGTIVCKIISADEFLVKVPIITEMIGKVQKNQQVIIKLNNKRILRKGFIERIEIIKNEIEYKQYAIIKYEGKNIYEIGMKVDIEIVLDKTTMFEYLLRILSIYN